MLDVKGFLDSPLHAIHQACKSSKLIILNVFNCIYLFIYLLYLFIVFYNNI